MRLAGFLKKSIREVEALDSREVSEWMAFDNLYGLGDGHAVIGQVCTSVYRAMTGAKVGPADFAPVFGAGMRKQSPAEMFAMMKATADVQNAREATKRAR